MFGLCEIMGLFILKLVFGIITSTFKTSESHQLWTAPGNHSASSKLDAELYFSNWSYKRLGWGVMLYFRHVSYQEGLSKNHFQSKGVKPESRIWYYETRLKTTNQPTIDNKIHLQLDPDTPRCFPCIWVSKYGKEYSRFIISSFDRQKDISKKRTVSNTLFCKSELLYCI